MQMRAIPASERFGIDSGVESIAAVLVGVRLAARLRHGHPDERKERFTLELVAASFFVLAGYLTVDGILSLVNGESIKAKSAASPGNPASARSITRHRVPSTPRITGNGTGKGVDASWTDSPCRCS
jgi:hypothetical protein